ncbi:HEAT repeat domain-containing protein [Streptomyces sp. 4.24]|uniref:HEAT repeat domain-containing protein n=1 Tax=Streptomyces tritrimontium TaxID=3406573 RepID=UPI003BB6FCB2
MSQNQVDALRRSGSATGHPEFAERMVEALQEGFRVLEALPPEDAFWRGWANGHATVHKLGVLAEERLRRDPADRTARWTLVALALAHGANDGGLSLLGPAIADDPTVVADALVIADWAGQEIGLDLTAELREACGWADRSALESLGRAEGGEAARRALRVLVPPAALPGSAGSGGTAAWLGGVGGTADELFAGALREMAAEGDADAVPCLIALHGRPTREVFERAALLLACEDPVERELGARVLRELGPYDAEGRRPFHAETVDVVVAEMGDEPDPGVLGWMIAVLGYHRARRALDLVLGLQAHPAQPVRFAVAAALPELADPERTERRVLEALLRLAGDDSGAVRWYALYALFNETAGVGSAQRRTWATHLTGQADTDIDSDSGPERREELAQLARVLDDQADTALLDILARTTGP